MFNKNSVMLIILIEDETMDAVIVYREHPKVCVNLQTDVR